MIQLLTTAATTPPPDDPADERQAHELSDDEALRVFQALDVSSRGMLVVEQLHQLLEDPQELDLTTHINTTTTENQNQDWGATNKNYPKPEKGCLRPLQSFPITNFPIAVLTVLNHFTKTLVTKMSKK